jgi:hypothetical protein
MGQVSEKSRELVSSLDVDDQLPPARLTSEVRHHLYLAVLMFTSVAIVEDNERIFGALKTGAGGYLLKRADPADTLIFSTFTRDCTSVPGRRPSSSSSTELSIKVGGRCRAALISPFLVTLRPWRAGAARGSRGEASNIERWMAECETD